MLSPQQSRLCQLAGMLSADGRCKTFDAAADGYVRGEAAETLAASTASATFSDGDGGLPSAILVLEGAAVNQDGRSGSLTAPHGPSQQAVKSAAMASMRGTGFCSDVCHLQLHGTGTALGDPIEINAASVALGISRGDDTDSAPLVLSAVKTHVGHGEPAAGITALIAAMSQLGGNLGAAPLLHLRRLNPHVIAVQQGIRAGALDQGVCIPRQQLASAAVVQAQASGVSSFAFQGTNAHAIVSVDYSYASTSSATNASPAVVFDRSRFWPVQQILTPSPLRASAATSASAMRYVSSPSEIATMWDHAVGGRPILPGAAMMELAYAAGKTSISRECVITTLMLVRSAILRPLALATDFTTPNEVHITVAQNGRMSIESNGYGADKNGRRQLVVHLECEARLSVASSSSQMTIAAGATEGTLPIRMHKVSTDAFAARVSQSSTGSPMIQGDTIDAGALDSCLQSAQTAAMGGTHFGGKDGTQTARGASFEPYVPALLGGYFKPPVTSAASNGGGDQAGFNVAVSAAVNTSGSALNASFSLSTSGSMSRPQQLVARVSDCVAKRMRVTQRPTALLTSLAAQSHRAASAADLPSLMYVPTVLSMPVSANGAPRDTTVATEEARQAKIQLLHCARSGGVPVSKTTAASDTVRNTAGVTALVQLANKSSAQVLGLKSVHNPTFGGEHQGADAEGALWSLLRWDRSIRLVTLGEF
jgi:hypothetical protein